LLGHVLIPSSRLLGSHDDLVLVSQFSVQSRVHGVKDVLVDTEVGYKVIKIIAQGSGLVLVLSASSGRADGVRVQLN
jgi:hypothetical protein